MLLAASDAGHFARDGCQKRRPTTFDAANGTGTETSSSRGLRMWERLRVNTSFGREPDMPCIHCHPSRARNRQAARRFHRLGGGRRPPARFSSLRGSGGARSRRLAANLRLGDGVAKRWRIRDTPLVWQTCLNPCPPYGVFLWEAQTGRDARANPGLPIISKAGRDWPAAVVRRHRSTAEPCRSPKSVRRGLLQKVHQGWPV